MFCAALMCLMFEFIIFCRKEIGAKAACKMLVKLSSETAHLLEDRVKKRINENPPRLKTCTQAQD